MITQERQGSVLPTIQAERENSAGKSPAMLIAAKPAQMCSQQPLPRSCLSSGRLASHLTPCSIDRKLNYTPDQGYHAKVRANC